MRLRARLAVTTVAIAVPMTLGLIALDARARHAAAEEALTTVALAHMLEGGAREHCEASPATWGGSPLRPPDGAPRPSPPAWSAEAYGRPPEGAGAPPVLFAYDEQLRAENPGAPPITSALAGSIEGQRAASAPFSWVGSTVEVLIRMPWGGGPCAFVIARGTTGPGWLGALLPASRIWLAPMVAVLVVMLLAVGPTVRRIRRLTEAVRRSADAGFSGSVSIEGRDEIAELGRAFDAAALTIREQLAEKDRREQALRDFLANTTHDVMIPLTVLKAHLAALEERAANNEPFDRSVLVSAMDEAHYLASLMHNLAIAAKLDTAEPRLQRGTVDLSALIGRVMGRHRPIARQLEVSLDSALPEAPVSVDADVTLLEQAVSNVVYNAIRHNRPGGHVAVILEMTGGGRENQFRVRVIDDGPGIPEADLSRLVERGFRGNDARTRAPAGQGLGLHITYRVAQLHGLKLTFQASEYGGLQVDIEGQRAPA